MACSLCLTTAPPIRIFWLFAISRRRPSMLTSCKSACRLVRSDCITSFWGCGRSGPSPAAGFQTARGAAPRTAAELLLPCRSGFISVATKYPRLLMPGRIGPVEHLSRFGRSLLEPSARSPRRNARTPKLCGYQGVVEEDRRSVTGNCSGVKSGQTFSLP